MQIGRPASPRVFRRSAWAAASGESSIRRLRTGVSRSLRSWPESRRRAGRDSSPARPIRGLRDRLREGGRARAAALVAVVDLGRESTGSRASRCTAANSAFVVTGEAVDGDHALDAELPDDREVSGQVGGAALDRCDPTVGISAVMLQRLHRRDEHDRARRQPLRAGSDVHELLEAHLRTEAALGDDVVAELEAEAVTDQRAVAVRDVREGAAVNEGRAVPRGSGRGSASARPSTVPPSHLRRRAARP